MSEFVPLALSPIAAREPTTVIDGWKVTSTPSTAALRISDETPLAKVLVKADAESAVASSLAVRFGRAQRDSTGALTIGAGPGEWLILAPTGTAEGVIERLRALVNDNFVTVIDQTCARALIRLRGPQSASMLCKLCAIDFADETTPNGSALRTSVAELVTDVVREDDRGIPAYWLHCEWSSGQYLFDALLNAGQEFDIEVDRFCGR